MGMVGTADWATGHAHGPQGYHLSGISEPEIRVRKQGPSHDPIPRLEVFDN